MALHSLPATKWQHEIAQRATLGRNTNTLKSALKGRDIQVSNPTRIFHRKGFHIFLTIFYTLPETLRRDDVLVDF